MTIRRAATTSQKLSKIIAELASEKNAEDVIILDMHSLVNFCDFFVICSGTSERHIKAIADGIMDGLRDKGVRVRYNSKQKTSNWIIFDSGDVVVHVFEKKAREFYNLEYLWRDAPQVL